MKFNPQLNSDIIELKRLSKLKDTTKYLQLKEKLKHKYKVTIRTIENYMNKRTPGKRKGRCDAGKLRNKPLPKEKRIIKEVLQGGTDIKDIKKIVKKKTGKEISDRKINNIRNIVEMDLINPPGRTDNSEPEESNFGDAAKDIFAKLFELDLIAPGHGVKIRVNGRPFIIPKEDVDDICLILANAYNRTAVNKLKVDREQILRQRLFHLVEAQVRLAGSGMLNSKEVESMIRQFQNLREEIELDANIRTVEKICKELKPDITWSEIGSLIKKHTDESD